MSIVCATDLLPKSYAAMDRAGILGDQLRAEVTLLHVVPPSDSQRLLDQTLDTVMGQMKSRAQPPLWRAERSPKVDVRVGDPARSIMAVLTESQPQLLVLGPHRKRPLRDALKGTILEKALAGRKCPVLIVRDEARLPYQRVLLALDLTAASSSAIRTAESLVLARGVEAQAVYAYEAPYQGMLHYAGAGIETLSGYSAGWEREAFRALRDLLKRESADFARYEIHIEQQRGAMGILRAAKRYGPDLFVIGTRAGGRVHRVLLGSVARRALYGIACDTLIVPVGSAGELRSKHVLSERRPRVTERQRSNSKATRLRGAPSVTKADD